MKSRLPIVVICCAISAVNASEVSLYGQVNRGVFGFHDGTSHEMVVVDNYMASSRFGFQGKQLLDNGLTASFTLEAELLGNASHQFVQQAGGISGTTPVNGTDTLTSRLEFVSLQGDYGNFALGKLSTAIDGALTQDLAGAKDVMSAEYRKIGGGLKFRTVGGGLSGFTIGGLTEAQSTNRSNALRYDSPIVGGVQAKASIAQGGDLDTALFYDLSSGPWKAKMAAGVYFNNDEATGSNTADIRYLASASVGHASGLAATVAASANNLANQTANTHEARSLYGKVGYTTGDYEFALDAGFAEHFQNPAIADNSLSTYGAAAQYNLANGVSLAALYRTVGADVTGTPTEDIHLYGMTMRVKF